MLYRWIRTLAGGVQGRKWVSTVLSAALLVSSLCAGKALSLFQGDEPLLDAAEVRQLRLSYPREVERMESLGGIAMDEIGEDELETIKSVVISNLDCPDYAFSEFLSEIARMLTEKRFLHQPAAVSGLDTGTENVTVTLHRAYGPLRGEYITEVTACSGQYGEAGRVTIGLDDGALFDGVTLSFGASASADYSVRSPAYDKTLCSGEVVTHRIAAGVFYAAIIRISYDLVDDGTGAAQHFDYYIVDQDTADTVCYTMLASIGIPTYVESADQNTVASYADLSVYQTRLEEDPAAVLAPSC